MSHTPYEVPSQTDPNDTLKQRCIEVVLGFAFAISVAYLWMAAVGL